MASGALREEVERVLAGAGLLDLFATVVCIDDVRNGKPDPEGYDLALARLNAAVRPDPPIAAADVLVFEDATVGALAAAAAGMRCVARAAPPTTPRPRPLRPSSTRSTPRSRSPLPRTDERSPVPDTAAIEEIARADPRPGRIRRAR